MKLEEALGDIYLNCFDHTDPENIIPPQFHPIHAVVITYLLGLESRGFFFTEENVQPGIVLED